MEDGVGDELRGDEGRVLGHIGVAPALQGVAHESTPGAHIGARAGQRNLDFLSQS
jgi:hypothetical protein